MAACGPVCAPPVVQWLRNTGKRLFNPDSRFRVIEIMSIPIVPEQARVNRNHPVALNFVLLSSIQVF